MVRMDAPLGRPAAPGEVAAAIVFLVSPDARYLRHADDGSARLWSTHPVCDVSQARGLTHVRGDEERMLELRT